MNVHVYVTNRPASSAPYQAGPILTSILYTSSAVYSSAVAGHSETSFCALAEKKSIIITAHHVSSSSYKIVSTRDIFL